MSEKAQFNEELTSLMLKSIKARACLCVARAPKYVRSVYNEAHEEAQEEYEMSIARDARVELYDAAVVKYREA